MAVRRFAAFAAGAWLKDMVIVSGVHVVTKRTSTTDGPRVTPRDERSQRRAKRKQRDEDEQQRTAQQRDRTGTAANVTNGHDNRAPLGQRATLSLASDRREQVNRNDDAPEFGGAGGLGDRGGVG